MAIVFDNTANLGNNGGSGSSFSASYTVGVSGNRLLLCSFEGDVDGGADDVTSVTYHGVSMTLLTKVVNTGNGNRQHYVYGLLSPQPGSNTLQVNCASSHYIILVAASYSGVMQSGLPDATGSNFLSSAASSVTVSLSTIANNCWIYATLSNPTGSATNDSATGYTFRAQDATFNQIGILDTNGALSSGGHSATLTQGSVSFKYTASLVSFAPAVTGLLPPYVETWS